MNEDIIPVDSYDFDDRIAVGLSLVFFYAQWCVHSRGLEPIIEEIADEYYDHARVYALDVEQSPDVAARFGVEGTPAVVIFRDGKIAERIGGANPPSTYAEALDALIAE